MKVFVAAVLISLASLVPWPSVAGAQVAANGVIINWSTDTYVPPGFTGKRLPTAGSNITAWVFVLQNGRQLDLSGTLVQWYADSQVLQSGTGLQKISFPVQKAVNQIVNLQARVQDANGQTLVGSIQVPVVPPKVVISSGYPGGVATTPTINASALPYFFNVTSPAGLTFSWAANGVQAQNAENPDSLAIDVSGASSGTRIRVDLTVANSTDSSAAKTSVNFIYQKI